MKRIATDDRHWSDLLPQARGKFLAVAGQEAFLADIPEEAWAQAQAAHPEDDGALCQYVFPEGGHASIPPEEVLTTQTQSLFTPQRKGAYGFQPKRGRACPRIPGPLTQATMTMAFGQRRQRDSSSLLRGRRPRLR
jgi:hypothetical protein